MAGEVEVDARLAARAAEIAAARGESIEAVIDRALRAYIASSQQPDETR